MYFRDDIWYLVSDLFKDLNVVWTGVELNLITNTINMRCSGNLKENVGTFDVDGLTYEFKDCDGKEKNGLFPEVLIEVRD